MNIIFWHYVSGDPKIKCRSMLHIFYGPESLPFILKTIGYINMIQISSCLTPLSTLNAGI